MAVKSRILYIEHKADIGGGQVSVLELLKRLDRNRFDPVVTCVSHGELYERVLELGVEVELLDIRGVLKQNPLSTLRSVRRLSKLVRDGGIRLIHANSQKAVLYCGAAPGLYHIPLLWHCMVPSDFGRVFDLIASIRSNIIIANSRHVGRRFKWLPRARGRVRVIPDGIDAETFQPGCDGEAVRSDLGIGHGDLVVGAAGRLVEEKGFEHFLRAAVLVASRVPEVKFIVAGEAPSGGFAYREKLERLAADVPAPSKVIFTGFRADVARVIAAMDIVVVPSLREGFGRVVGEAMAMGKPVICSEVGGIPELISSGVTGILVPPGHADAIASQVLDLATDPERASGLGEAARLRILTDFSIDRHVRLIENTYTEMLKN